MPDQQRGGLALGGDVSFGVAQFLGFEAGRGVSVPVDFVAWLIESPRELDVEQCIALHLAARSWTVGGANG